MTRTEILQIIASFLGSMGFGILFNIRGKRLLVAAIGGMLSWIMFILMNKAIGSEVIAYFISASFVSIYAEIMARKLKTPTTTFIIISLVPMIPGGSLYYTMVSAFNSGGADFISRGTHTMELAAALALGVVIVTTFTRMFHKSAKYE